MQCFLDVLILAVCKCNFDLCSALSVGKVGNNFFDLEGKKGKTTLLGPDMHKGAVDFLVAEKVKISWLTCVYTVQLYEDDPAPVTATASFLHL